MIHSLPWLCKRHIKVEFFCSFCDSVHDWESKQPGWLETMKVLTHITDEVQKDFPGQSQLSLLFLVLSLRMIDPFGTRSSKEVSISYRLLQKIFSTGTPLIRPPLGHKILVAITGLLIGCGKKWKILRHFQGKLCGKKGLLCGKLCDFFKADLTLFFRSQRRKTIFLLSNGQLGIKKQAHPN